MKAPTNAYGQTKAELIKQLEESTTVSEHIGQHAYARRQATNAQLAKAVKQLTTLGKTAEAELCALQLALNKSNLR